MFSPGICWSGLSLKRSGSLSPVLADELVGREALERLEPAAEVVGGDEVAKMPLELVVIVVVDSA